LSDIRSLLPLDAAAEITMEANPGTVEVTRFKSYVASGVNRFSLGIQSFNSEHLQALGRIHDGDEARRAVDAALTCTDNVNLDLMYALPSQSIEQAQQDLEIALGFQPTHLSLYHLTMEPNTVFAKYPPPLPDDDTSATMQQQIQQRMTAAGFEHYEVSAFAKPGRRARHNLNYWEFGDYLGIGAGAHSKLSFPHRIIRQARFKQPASYLQNASIDHLIQDEHEIERESLGFEFMLNALRLTEGVPTRLFIERTGQSTQSIEPALLRAEAKGLIQVDHQRIQPTELGQRFLNDLQQMFLPD
jgi:oxygen-independent coproporphyrinogen-3 oxidase